MFVLSSVHLFVVLQSFYYEWMSESSKTGSVMSNSCYPMDCRMGFPGGASGKEPAFQHRRCKRPGFDPWVGKIPWKRAWQHPPIILPGESYGERSLGGYSPQDHEESTWSDWNDLAFMDCCTPGCSVLGTDQARILGWVAIPFCRQSSPPRDRTQVSCIAGRFFIVWTTREACISL